MGIEPTRGCPRQILSLLRLPIPPPCQVERMLTETSIIVQAKIEGFFFHDYYIVMKKVFLVLLLLFCFTVFISANESQSTGDDFFSEILVSDEPIVYGDDNFRERILKRTEGKRDPIGLVLTGGSARACAHIGVLKYLDEIGLEPDYIVSNSMGSIIGMLYAAGIKPSQIEEMLLAGDLSSYFSLALPTNGGFLSSDGFKTLVDYIVGKDYRIEETEIPIMVVCDDLVTKREVRITEGSFSDILIGSFALPAYFSPFEYNGHLLIDGGVISLAPIDAAYEYSDTVILSTTFYDANEINLINPVTILNSSFDIGKRQNASRDLKKYSSLYLIRCDVEKFSFMAFEETKEMAEIGYESAKKEASFLLPLAENSLKNDREEDPLINERIRETKNNISFFGRLKSSKASTSLGIKFLAMNSSFSPYYLKNSLTTGLEYKLLVSNLDMALIFGLGNNSQNLSSSEWFTTLGGYIAYYPFSFIRAKIEAYSDFLRPNAEFEPFISLRESIDSYLYRDEKLMITLNQSLEYAKDYFPNKVSEAVVLSLLTQAKYKISSITLTGDLGYLLVSDDFTFSNVFNYIQTTIGGEYDISKNLYLKANVRARFSVDKKGSVPIFVSDNFTSSSTKYGPEALKTNSSTYNLFADLSFGYNLSSSPTFGEFLIFDSSSVALYFSSLTNIEDGFRFSTGLEFNTDISLIGLTSLPMCFRIGYEYGRNNTITASIVFSSRY